MFDYALFLKSAVLILEVCSYVYNRKMLLKYLKTQHKSLYSVTSHTASSSSPLYVNSMCGLWCHKKTDMGSISWSTETFHHINNGLKN